MKDGYPNITSEGFSCENCHNYWSDNCPIKKGKRRIKCESVGVESCFFLDTIATNLWATVGFKYKRLFLVVEDGLTEFTFEEPRGDE